MKHAILKVSPILFLEMCKHGTAAAKIVANAVPGDAKFIRATYIDTPGDNYIELIIESSSFKEISYGNTIPHLPNPVFEKVK